MGSRSAKLAPDTDKHKTVDGHKLNTHDEQHVKSVEENMPNLLVSLVRSKTLLVSEGRNVATQTDEANLPENIKISNEATSNDAVTYDIEAVIAPYDTNFHNGDGRTLVTGGANTRERSDIGTNTIVSAFQKTESSKKNDIQPEILSERDKLSGNHDTSDSHSANDRNDADETPIEDLCLERYGKYRVKVENDEDKCTVSALTFLDTGDLVLIDRSNQKIKYVDAAFRYISAQNLPAKPWAVCARGVDVYVTIGNTHVQHLYVKDMIIEPVRSFEVKGRCLGICIFGEYIAVGLQVGQVHLLDTMGENHGTIHLPEVETDKPCNPWHLSVSRENNLLITDSDSGVMFCVNKQSEMVFQFVGMSAPRGTTVDSQGNILVVGRDQDSGTVVRILPRDWELRGMLHIDQGARTGSRALLTWRELEFVPYCVDFRCRDGVMVMGGIRESLKIMKLTSSNTKNGQIHLTADSEPNPSP